MFLCEHVSKQNSNWAEILSDLSNSILVICEYHGEKWTTNQTHAAEDCGTKSDWGMDFFLGSFYSKAFTTKDKSGLLRNL